LHTPVFAITSASSIHKTTRWSLENLHWRTQTCANPPALQHQTKNFVFAPFQAWENAADGVFTSFPGRERIACGVFRFFQALENSASGVFAVFQALECLENSVFTPFQSRETLVMFALKIRNHMIFSKLRTFWR
jgi:hypothetical protein